MSRLQGAGMHGCYYYGVGGRIIPSLPFHLYGSELSLEDPTPPIVLPPIYGRLDTQLLECEAVWQSLIMLDL